MLASVCDKLRNGATFDGEIWVTLNYALDYRANNNNKY